ncbi:5'-deoxynucleotidase [Pseudanabaena phage Pam3]|nr:5'-deoxynucleotidase [Pseudanabaena phage Pam3]
MQLVDRIRAVREAAAVQRCHTVPHLSSYSNGAHTYGVCVLLRLLWPDEPHLVDFALFHDTPERWTGDVPSQVINRHNDLRDALAREDERISGRLHLPCEHALDFESFIKLKACDRLELWLWTWEEEALGNKHVLNMRASLDATFADPGSQTPSQVLDLISKFRHEGWRRLPEVLS